jgi:hypothetical protein
VVSAQIFQENTFLETKSNFSLTGKCFPLTNFPNGKQTQESLESGFPESEFRETNIALESVLVSMLSRARRRVVGYFNVILNINFMLFSK